MKKQTLFVLCTLFLGFFLSGSSSWNSSPLGAYVPIFMERSELEKSVFWQSEARDMERPGKIYHKAPYIYVNERYQGVHVINNSDPKHPKREGFIVAPGCIDMAVKGEILYLDNAIDLVSFDLTKKQAVHRVKDIFPEPSAPDNGYYPVDDRPENYVLVGWKFKK